MSDLAERQPQSPEYETDEPVRFETDGPVAWITMQRTTVNNVQNSQMTYALDDAFNRASMDDDVKVIVLAGEGKHFSAGHDIGSPGRDHLVPFEHRLMVPDHTNKPGPNCSIRARKKFISACAAAGATSPSRPSRRCRARAWRAA